MRGCVKFFPYLVIRPICDPTSKITMIWKMEMHNSQDLRQPQKTEKLLWFFPTSAYFHFIGPSWESIGCQTDYEFHLQGFILPFRFDVFVSFSPLLIQGMTQSQVSTNNHLFSFFFAFPVLCISSHFPFHLLFLPFLFFFHRVRIQSSFFSILFILFILIFSRVHATI